MISTPLKSAAVICAAAKRSFDSRYLFTRYQVTNCHDAPQFIGMRWYATSNPPHSVALFQKT
jgi:hypothetical protein